MIRRVVNNPLRVLEIIRQLDYGGGEQHVKSLIRGLDRRKISPHVIGYSGGAVARQLREIGIPCEIIKLDLRTLPGIIRYIREEKIDLVHGHGTKGALLGVFAAKIAGVPFIYTEHGWCFHEKQALLRHLLSIIAENIICVLADKIICVSAGELGKIKPLVCVDAAKVRLVRHGIDLEVFNPDNFHSEIARKEKGDKFIIALVGRVTIQKDPECFFRVAKLFNNNPRCEFWIVGDGDLLGKVERDKNDAGLRNLFFYPPTDKTPELLNQIDCLVVPSFWEAGPLNVLEAMAMGRVCISAKVGLAKEVIINREKGI